jgi:hypothetical protein
MNVQPKILDIIDLTHYDHDLGGLYHRLAALRRDYYGPHEKIVIHHHDHEYFYLDHITGITTHNLMTIITRLGISLNVFVIFTTYQRYRESVEPWITDHRDVPDIRVTLIHPVYVTQIPRDPSGACGVHRDIRYHALCILGRRRPHKELLLKWMISRGVLDRIQVNFNSGPDNEKGLGHSFDKNLLDIGDIGLIYPVPYRGDGAAGLVPVRHPLINELHSVAIPEKLISDIIPLPTVDDHRDYPAGYPHDFFRWVGFAVVAESMIENQHQFPISEKILKPLITQTPFVVLGARHLLRRLRDNGFETFGDWWDESYDDIRDPQERFAQVCAVIEDLVRRPISDIRSMYASMLPVLEHNQNMIIDHIDNELPRQYNGYWNA